MPSIKIIHARDGRGHFDFACKATRDLGKTFGLHLVASYTQQPISVCSGIHIETRTLLSDLRGLIYEGKRPEVIVSSVPNRWFYHRPVQYPNYIHSWHVRQIEWDWISRVLLPQRGWDDAELIFVVNSLGRARGLMQTFEYYHVQNVELIKVQRLENVVRPGYIAMTSTTNAEKEERKMDPKQLRVTKESLLEMGASENCEDLKAFESSPAGKKENFEEQWVVASVAQRAHFLTLVSKTNDFEEDNLTELFMIALNDVNLRRGSVVEAIIGRLPHRILTAMKLHSKPTKRTYHWLKRSGDGVSGVWKTVECYTDGITRCPRCDYDNFKIAEECRHCKAIITEGGE